MRDLSLDLTRHRKPYNVNYREEDDSPSDLLVKSDVLVEWNNVVQWRPTKERDEVAADGKENEDDVDCASAFNCPM